MLPIHLPVDSPPVSFCPANASNASSRRFFTRQLLPYLCIHTSAEGAGTSKSPCNVVPSISTVKLPGLDHRQGIPHPELAFEVQRAAHSCQTPLHHDGNPVTQHVGLLHAVRCQDDSPVPPVLLDHIPGESGHMHKPSISPLRAARCQAGNVTREAAVSSSTACFRASTVTGGFAVGQSWEKGV